jgi:ankyrin repeat protein
VEILASTSDVLFPAELGEAPVQIDSTDCDGDTPLQVMVWRNDLHGVQTLIEAGADVNAIGDMSETPLHVAVSQENVAIIDALLNAKARTDIRSEFDETASERALKKGGEIAKLLRRVGGA